MKFRNEYLAIQSNLDLPIEKWLEIEPFFSEIKIEKGGFFVQSGQVCRNFALVTSGIMKIYFLDRNQNEFVKNFRGKGEMIAAYPEILKNLPSRSFIQALTPATALVADFDEFDRLAQKDIYWSQILRKVAEFNYVEKEEREYEFLQLSAMERYQEIAKNHPDWIENIPQYQIASYLGITPVALSRLVNK